MDALGGRGLMELATPADRRDCAYLLMGMYCLKVKRGERNGHTLYGWCNCERMGGRCVLGVPA